MAKRLTPYLEASVLALPLADRTYLLGRLQSSLRRDRRATAQERMGYLASKMRDTSGIDVTTPERYAAATWARYIFIYISRQEGYSQRKSGPSSAATTPPYHTRNNGCGMPSPSPMATGM